LREAFASALGQPRRGYSSTSNQTCHGFGGPLDHNPSVARTRRFQHITRHLRLGAAGRTCDSFKQDSHFRINPDVE
jgi:hypothetical protein